MRTTWETLYTFDTANFRLSWAVAPDDDLDLSWDESGEVREGLQSGHYQAFISRMTVTHKPTGATLGEDYLGGSIYEKPSEFRDHIGARGKYGSYFRGMVSEAIAQARKQVATLQGIHLRPGAAT